MLSIRYGSDVPPAISEQVERHAKAEGVSLYALEVIGASLDFAESFIVACEDGRGQAWLQDAGLAAPSGTVARARWVADRVFGPA